MGEQANFRKCPHLHPPPPALEGAPHTHLYNVIVKQEPEAVTFHNSNVMPPVRTAGKEQKKGKQPS